MTTGTLSHKEDAFVPIHLHISTQNLASLHRKNGHKTPIDIPFCSFNCCLVLHPFIPPESLCYYFIPSGGYVARKQHHQPVSTEVVYHFGNQNSTNFPEDHCCIFLCRLRSLSSSITTQSSVSVLAADCGFHCIFGTGMLPPTSAN
jgi:hypothetical protein